MASGSNKLALNKRQRRAVGDYARALADRMGLRDWTIHVMHQAADDDTENGNPGDVCLASVETSFGRRHAYIYVNTRYFDLDRDEQRSTIVHELLHCTMAPTQDHVRLGLPKHLGQQSYDLFYQAYLQHLELAIDNLADSFSRHLPYPDFDE